MGTVAHTPAPQLGEGPASLPPQRRREIVQRVLDSQQFRRSPAMRAFLVYVTENQILGRTDKLKEHSIGSEVLGRRPDYNPTEDNIVRVRAHELRVRLEKYFATEGADEPILITIPKGGYSPEFAARDVAPPSPVSLAGTVAEAPGTGSSAAASTGSTAPQVGASDRGAAKPFPVMRALMVLLLIAVAVGATFGITRALDTERGRAVSEPSAGLRDFWTPVFARSPHELKVVYADTSFALWQDLNGEDLDLGDYLNRKYLDVKGNALFNVAVRRVTTPADMALAVNLATLSTRFGGTAEPMFARDADSKFFHQGNVLLIGSRRSNPWVAIYEPSMSFQLGKDELTHAPLFRNRAPRAGEQATYTIPAMYDTQKVEEKTYPSYGVVALLKGCGSQGYTILVEGLNAQATQAAGDFVTDPQRVDVLLSAIGHKPGTDVAPFEALFQITSMPGGYDNPKVLASRMRTQDACSGG